MTNENTLDFLKRLAKGISAQFGRNCEIVIHDISKKKIDYPIIFIENGNVTKRTTDSSASRIVLETLKCGTKSPEDKLNYITKSQNGKILKSSTIYIKDEYEKIKWIFSINYDITELGIAQNAINSLINIKEVPDVLNKIPQNVNQLLEELIEESVNKIGKPVALMSKKQKIKAIQYLNEAGAFLITKSGDKISDFFGISKYSIYNYIDAKK